MKPCGKLIFALFLDKNLRFGREDFHLLASYLRLIYTKNKCNMLCLIYIYKGAIMRYIKSFLVLATAVLGFSFADVQAQNFSDNGKVSESNIEKKVFKEILRLPYYGVFDNIAFKVDGDTVTLYGKVVRPMTKSSAKNVVEDIKGVRNVVNNIEVLPLSGFDDSIRLRTLRTFQTRGGSLYRYFLGTNSSVKIIVDRGHLTLEGYVANRGDYNLMNVLANGVTGVFSVDNNLIVEKGSVR